MNQIMKVFRNGLIYGIIFFTFSYILCNLINLPLRETLIMSGSIGFAALAINGLIHRKFTKPLKILQAINTTLQDSEIVKIQTPANHTIDEHLVPGKLFITDKRLVFISCEQEERAREEFSWSLAGLQSFKFYPTIFNAGGEFIVYCNGQQLVFEVDELSMWKKALLQKQS